MSRARIIRKGSGPVKKDGFYKMARDSRTRITAEKIKAAGHRPCAKPGCQRLHAARFAPAGYIIKGNFYVKVLNPTLAGPRIQGHSLPMYEDFHPLCVPDHAKPLLRFLGL